MMIIKIYNRIDKSKFAKNRITFNLKFQKYHKSLKRYLIRKRTIRNEAHLLRN